MNIQDLAEQAKKSVPAGLAVDKWIEVYNEKFAKLLEKEFEAKHFSEGYKQGRSDGTMETARECIQLADQYGSGGAGSEFDVGYCSCANTLSDEFKKRFGVEE